MKKRMKLAGVVFSAILAMTALGGCGGDANIGKNEIRIGSTYNTLKIERTGEYPDLGKNLLIVMTKGETEGAQIMVTPERDVEAYNVTVSDLIGPNGAKIDKASIKTYSQKYLQVLMKSHRNTNEDYMPGFYPDMTLPIETDVRYGENSIKAGNNQAFTIEVTTTSETVSGEYKGTVTLTLDDTTEILPLSVTVYDIDVTQSYGRTAFCWWENGTMVGELSYTSEIYTKYYEKMLNEYRSCLTKVPYSHDPVAMAKSVDKYFDNPNFTTYLIPSLVTTSNQFNSGRFMDYLVELAKLSRPGRILFSKAISNYADEPAQSAYPQIVATRDAIYGCEEDLILKLEDEGYFDDYDEEYKRAFCKEVRGIDLVIAVASTQAVNTLGAGIDTYCAVLDQLDTENYREKYAAAAAATKAAGHGGELWYYTCVQPVYPYPSHHIDDALVGSRIMSWMQKAYNLDGYLYWSIGSFAHLDSGWNWCDPYNDPCRFGTNNGDGYLVYPGVKYGMDVFIPSIRLAAFRDGQEDLSMLYELGKLLSEYGEYYGVGADYFSLNDLMKDTYKNLFTGTIYEKSDENFYAQREKTMRIFIDLKNEGKFVHKVTIDKTEATVEFYLENGYSLYVNGEKVEPVANAGSGNKYVVVKTLNEHTELESEVRKEDRVVTRRTIVAGDKTAILDLGNDKVTVTEGSEISYSDDGLAITLRSKGETLTDRLQFEPAVSMPASLFANDYKKIGDLTFKISNPTAEDITLRIRLQSGRRSAILKENAVIPAGGNITFTIHDVGENKISSANTVNIQIYADNVDVNNELLPDRTFVINEAVYTVKE